MTEPLLASDADRDVALSLLRDASVDGRLTLDDLAERASLVHAARTRDDVATATAGLQAQPKPAPAQEVEHHRAVLSSVNREGRWQLAPRNRFTAILGSVRLDLREAVLPGPEVEIEARAVLGSVELLVSEGVEVVVTGGAPLSSQEIRVDGAAPEGAPLIRVRYSGALGSLAVRSRPRLVDQIKDSARRLLSP